MTDELYLGSAYEGDEAVNDASPDDILFAGDADFDRSMDDVDYGAAKRKKARRAVKRATMVEQVLMSALNAGVAAGATTVLTFTPTRDCRLLDLRVAGVTPVTGVVNPGIQVTNIQCAGAQLVNSAAAFSGAHLAPTDRRAGAFNLTVKGVIKQNVPINVTIVNTTAATVLDIEGTILCRVRL